MKKYQIIYADPPWSYDDKIGSGNAKMGSCEYHYSTMTMEDIDKLPINSLADKNCILFLWVTMPLLNKVFQIISDWGFTYKTVAFVWIKLNPKSGNIFKGIGRWVQGNAEMVLLATVGKPQRISKSISQIIMEKRSRHSEKPHIIREKIIELMGDLPRIELFARHKAKGWDAWGNEELEEAYIQDKLNDKNK